MVVGLVVGRDGRTVDFWSGEADLGGLDGGGHPVRQTHSWRAIARICNWAQCYDMETSTCRGS